MKKKRKGNPTYRLAKLRAKIGKREHLSKMDVILDFRAYEDVIELLSEILASSKEDLSPNELQKNLQKIEDLKEVPLSTDRAYLHDFDLRNIEKFVNDCREIDNTEEKLVVFNYIVCFLKEEIKKLTKYGQETKVIDLLSKINIQ